MAPSASRGPRSSRAWKFSGAAPGILLPENRFGDDDSLDLRGPLADLREFHVAVDAFYRVVLDEAVPAVDLHPLRPRLPPPRVQDAGLQRGPAQSHGHGADADPPLLQRAHRLPVPVAWAADQVRLR